MDQYSSNPGGAANTPPFGSEPAALDTAADHQLPGAGETGGSLSGRSSIGGGTSGSASSGTGRSGAGGSGAGSQSRVDQLGDRLEESVNQQMHRTAEQLDTAAEQIDRFADQRTRGATGVKAQAGAMAHSVADVLETASSYLRDNDVESLRADLGRQLRERPLQTLLVGVAAGWVVGKILR